MGVAEELDEFLFGDVAGGELFEHALAHSAIGGFILSGEQDGFGG